MKNSRACGFTLIELLVVMGILGLLIQMLLPAVEMAREAARRVQCQNNLRQIGLAMVHHLDVHGGFPSAGWGYEWAPDPDGGSGLNQPGGWGYSLLPYLEQQALHDLGTGGTEAVKRAANKQRLQVALPIWHCPSRRRAAVFPVPTDRSFVFEPYLCESIASTKTARTDYAACGGEIPAAWLPGPKTLKEGRTTHDSWLEPTDDAGVIWLHYNTRAAQITDGLSKTYLVGEKMLVSNKYKTGNSIGDDQGPYLSDNRDHLRFTGNSAPEGAGLHPVRDHSNDELGRDSRRFGSAHPRGFSMVHCDGSAHFISYDVDSLVFANGGNRSDGRIE